MGDACNRSRIAELEGFTGEAVLEVQGYVAVMAVLVGIVNTLEATAAQALADAHDWHLRYRQVLASNSTAMVDFSTRAPAPRVGAKARPICCTPTSLDWRVCKT